MIVLYAGVTSFVESIKKIINPEAPEYTTTSLIIVGVAVLVKIVLGLYVKSTGQKVNSDSLVNSGKDALLDSVISFSTLVAALVFMFAGISLEAWLGAIISLIIIKEGCDMLSDTISKILGEPGDVKLVQDIKRTVSSFDEVKGAYDLVLHNYGPDVYNGSIHIEVEDNCPVTRLDELNREIVEKVMQEHDVLLMAVGVYSVNTKDQDVIDLRNKIRDQVLSHKYAKQMHGFYYSKKDNYIRFDVVISFDAESRKGVYQEIVDDLKKTYPEMNFVIAMDMDYSEIV